MTTMQQNTKEYFRIINILYFALIAGQLAFCAIILFLILSVGNYQETTELKNAFYLIVPVFAIAAIYGSQYLFKIKLNDIKNKSKLSEKLTDYKSACIIRWAILEAPSFLAIVAAFITGEVLLLGIVAIMIAWFVAIRPGVQRAINELDLDYNDKMILNDPEAIIT